jgi:hypothetical protein
MPWRGKTTEEEVVGKDTASNGRLDVEEQEHLHVVAGCSARWKTKIFFLSRKKEQQPSR